MDTAEFTRKQFFEDFPEDFSYNYKVAGLSKKEIIEFAKVYDPQRFHLSEEEASKTHFGKLVASGFQTQLKCFNPFCVEVLNHSGCVGSPGINIQWLAPWYPSTELDVTVKLIDKRASSKRNDRGYINFKMDARHNDTPIMRMDWTVIMLTQNSNEVQQS